MMLMSAVLAVAFGLTPVTESKSPQLIEIDARTIGDVGRYKQYVGKDGKTHLRGFDPMGRRYEIAIDRNGHVDGEVGERVVSFDVADPA
jgi:hypothetical protein